MKSEKVEQLIELRAQVDEAAALLTGMRKNLETLEEELVNAANEDGLSSMKLENGTMVLFSSRGYYKIKGGVKDPEPRRKLYGELMDLGYGAQINMVPEMQKAAFDAALKEIPMNTKLRFINQGWLSHYEKPIVTVRKGKK